MILGTLPEAVEEEPTLELELRAGDRIILHTDGITDVFDSRGKKPRIEGVQKIRRETSLLPFREMREDILNRVAAWRQGQVTDDMSLVLVEV